ncbi:transketolase [compost metagenome]
MSFAIHQRLDNLTLVIDQNGLQGFGRTVDVISCDDLTPRIAAFGADVRHADGHDPDAIADALASPAQGVPRVLILDTVKGRGLHFEDQLESHYLPLSEAEYLAARNSLEREDIQ